MRNNAWLVTMMIGALLAGCAGDDSSMGDDDGGGGGSGGGYPPRDVFDGCDASQTQSAVCYLLTGAKPADYKPLPQDDCATTAPSHATLTCPTAHLVGVCETRHPPNAGYSYYYDTNQGNLAAQTGCEAAGAIWHKP